MLLIYKGKLDNHLENMEKHWSGVYAGATCPEPCKINYMKIDIRKLHNLIKDNVFTKLSVFP